MSHAGTENKLLEQLFPEITPDTIILDVGHGYGATGLLIRSKVNLNRVWCQLWGVEVYEPYHEMHRRMGMYDQLFLCNALDMPFADKSVDYSVMTHVIEHTEKRDGLKLISELERVTRKRVIISTPNGYTESGPLDENDYNNHRSAWRPREFKERGYATRVVTKNVNSRLLVAFAKLVFALKGKQWENEVIVAWKDLELVDRIEACGCASPDEKIRRMG